MTNNDFVIDLGMQLSNPDAQENLDRFIKQPPFGYILHPQDPIPVKTPYYGLKQDPLKKYGCIMALINKFDSAMWIRVSLFDIETI